MLTKTLLSAVCLAVLAACANQPTGLTANQLESERYYLTERRRLPIDFPEIQSNLFKHEAACGVKYTFQLEPNKTSYARVFYRMNDSDRWEDSVLLSLVLLHNATINVTAYSYQAGQMDRVHKMLTAMMSPDKCQADTSWENSLDKDD